MRWFQHVSFIEPRFLFETEGLSNDDHPHADIRNGEAFMNLVYAALTISPAWSRTVLVINYDEWGGFFDHVPPNELSRFSDSLRSDGESLGLRRFTEASVLHRQSVAGGPIVSKLDAVANPEAGNAVDSEGIVARALSEVMPAGFHIDDACASVEDAYALLRRLAHAKAPHDPIAAGPGCSDG